MHFIVYFIETFISLSQRTNRRIQDALVYPVSYFAEMYHASVKRRTLRGNACIESALQVRASASRYKRVVYQFLYDWDTERKGISHIKLHLSVCGSVCNSGDLDQAKQVEVCCTSSMDEFIMDPFRHLLLAEPRPSRLFCHEARAPGKEHS